MIYIDIRLFSSGRLTDIPDHHYLHHFAIWRPHPVPGSHIQRRHLQDPFRAHYIQVVLAALPVLKGLCGCHDKCLVLA